jgi:hypothetical protein
MTRLLEATWSKENISHLLAAANELTLTDKQIDEIIQKTFTYACGH